MDKVSDYISENKVSLNEAQSDAKDKSSLIYGKISKNKIMNVSFMDDKFIVLHQISN